MDDGSPVGVAELVGSATRMKEVLVELRGSMQAKGYAEAAVELRLSADGEVRVELRIESEIRLLAGPNLPSALLAAHEAIARMRPMSCGAGKPFTAATPDLHGMPDHIAIELTRNWGFEVIPERMWQPIAAYVMDGRIPGDFLQSVICDDFCGGVLRADQENRANLRAFAGFFHNHAPPLSTGSRALMAAWSRRGGQRRGRVESTRG